MIIILLIKYFNFLNLFIYFATAYSLDNILATSTKVNSVKNMIFDMDYLFSTTVYFILNNLIKTYYLYYIVYSRVYLLIIIVDVLRAKSTLCVGLWVKCIDE